MNNDLKYPTVSEVLPFVEATAPNNWAITYEFPNDIGVDHPSFNDTQMIFLGDVNGFFGFNDQSDMDLNGYMEEITNPEEIAKSFWDQMAKLYPKLFKEVEV
jgi:hypothetical protein